MSARLYRLPAAASAANDNRPPTLAELIADSGRRPAERLAIGMLNGVALSALLFWLPLYLLIREILP